MNILQSLKFCLDQFKHLAMKNLIKKEGFKKKTNEALQIFKFSPAA